MEDKLIVQSLELRNLFAGCKMYSIRRGHRSFATNLRVLKGDSGAEFSCITNSYVHTLLSQVPFLVFEAEGFRNFQETLDTLRIFYPEMTADSPVTIVEYRLAL